MKGLTVRGDKAKYIKAMRARGFTLRDATYMWNKEQRMKGRTTLKKVAKRRYYKAVKRTTRPRRRVTGRGFMG